MRVVVINTGTELLLGAVLNTHLGFIAREIFALHLRVERQITVPDGVAIRDALAENLERADLIFVTGGLGPTTDDITREAAAEVLGLELAPNEILQNAITHRLRRHKIRMTDRVLRQALVPRGAEFFPNESGTAPGLYLAANLNPAIRSPHLFLLPGPPRELEPMFVHSVLPIVRRIVGQEEAVFDSRTFRLVGTGESYVEEAVGEELLAIAGLELGYCARMGEVDLRLIGPVAALEKAELIVRAKLESFIFSTASETLETVVVRRLIERRQTLAVAESCTGGYLAHRITNVPGASAIFLAGFVTYANEAKADSLGIDLPLIAEHGAVSEPVARAMARGARAKAGATFGIATTGVAGPGGGSEAKPVGTLFLALADAEETIVRRHFFPTERETFKQLATQAALNLLRERLSA